MTHDITHHGGDEIRVTGRLVEDAHFVASHGANPAAILILNIEPTKGMPYHARLVLGVTEADHYRGQARALSMKRGVHVRVFAKGLRISSDHGKAMLVLMDVTDAFPITNDQVAMVAAAQEA